MEPHPPTSPRPSGLPREGCGTGGDVLPPIRPSLSYEELRVLVAERLRYSRGLESRGVTCARYQIERAPAREGVVLLADQLAAFHGNMRGSIIRANAVSHASVFHVSRRLADGVESMFEDQMEKARRCSNAPCNKARAVVSTHWPRACHSPVEVRLPQVGLSLPRPRIVHIAKTRVVNSIPRCPRVTPSRA